MIKNAVIAGTFDPVTIGHLDIIKRASEMFGRVYVGIFENTQKNTMFSAKTRYDAMCAAVKDLENVFVEEAGNTTLSDFAAAHSAVIVKGIRNGVDADYEISLAGINKQIGNIETVILPTSPELSFISSTFVRDMIKYEKPYEKYVPSGVPEILAK
ncbi:MAG: pantetheine-phosphate adenylyltransferase [Clostridiales bacterium]|nr:pantetheine-phosphate adenylyltransferase [Clostridiales bacterium]